MNNTKQNPISVKVQYQLSEKISSSMETVGNYQMHLASRRCLDRDESNSLGQDVMGWGESSDHIVAVVCDGISGSNKGELAASAITSKGLGYLLRNPDVDSKDFVKFLDAQEINIDTNNPKTDTEITKNTEKNVAANASPQKAKGTISLSSIIESKRLEMAKRRESVGSATTAQFLIINKSNDEARLIQLGDSPAFLKNKSGNILYQQTNESAWSSKNQTRHELIQERKFSFASTGTVLLCSDGLSGTKPVADDIELLEKLMTSSDSQYKEQIIAERAQDDDLAAILIQRNGFAEFEEKLQCYGTVPEVIEEQVQFNEDVEETGLTEAEPQAAEDFVKKDEYAANKQDVHTNIADINARIVEIQKYWVQQHEVVVNRNKQLLKKYYKAATWGGLAVAFVIPATIFFSNGGGQKLGVDRAWYALSRNIQEGYAKGKDSIIIAQKDKVNRSIADKAASADFVFPTTENINAEKSAKLANTLESFGDGKENSAKKSKPGTDSSNIEAKPKAGIKRG